jgi:hypothetical protein
MTKSKMADIIEQNERLTKEMEILKAQAAEQARARETADPRYIKGAADKDFVEAVARKMLELQKK